jgi:hypothetical protein
MWTTIIILGALALIIGNIMLIKHSAKMKWPTPTKKPPAKNKNDHEDEDSSGFY